MTPSYALEKTENRNKILKIIYYQKNTWVNNKYYYNESKTEKYVTLYQLGGLGVWVLWLSVQTSAVLLISSWSITCCCLPDSAVLPESGSMTGVGRGEPTDVLRDEGKHERNISVTVWRYVGFEQRCVSILCCRNTCVFWRTARQEFVWFLCVLCST